MNDSYKFNRRQIIHAGFLAAMSGCSGSLVDALHGTQLTLRLLTPWPALLCREWVSSFRTWGKSNNLPIVKINWQPIREEDIGRLYLGPNSGIHGVLGGHFEHHREAHAQFSGTYALQPVRQMAVCTEPGRTSAENRADSWISTFDINTWGNSGHGLSLDNPGNNDLSNIYTQAVWNAAPDPHAAYARIVLLCRFVDGIRDVSDRLMLVPIDKNEEPGQSPTENSTSNSTNNNCRPLIASNGLKSALGVEQDRAVHWPECLSITNSGPIDEQSNQLFLQYCQATGRLSENELLRPKNAITDSFRRDLVSILVHHHRANLAATWRKIEPTGAEIRKRVEAYITSPPPWPPASIVDLQKRRGFEFIVALVEEIAENGDQRDWMIREFQRPQAFIDTRMLDAALDGQLLNNRRFRSWLRAEWTAWIDQRCRRAQRFIDQGNDLNSV